MKSHPPVRPTRPNRVVILAAFIAALLSTQLSATVITYTDGQTDATARSVSAPNDPTTLTIASGVATQSGLLSGTGTLIKAGAGSLTLSGANTFIGPVQLNAGTLNIFHDSNLGAAGNALTLAGGTLQTSSTYSSHPLALSSATTIDTAFGSTTLQNAALTGVGALTKTGGGTFFLGAGSGNFFAGDITLAVSGGTFQIGSSVSSNPAGGATLSSLTAANTLTVNRGATFRIEDNGTASGAGYIADRIGTAGNRPAVSMNGGTFLLNGGDSADVMTQTLGALTLASGASTITATRVSVGTPELVFSSLSRNSGSFVNFTGTALGTGTSDARIHFSSSPALTGGGGVPNAPTVSILTGGRSGDDLGTYGANGIRPLVAAEYNAVAGNDINGAGTTDNVKIANSTPAAFVALSAPRTVNALINTVATTATWAMGNTLTLTSGQFIHTPSNTLNISSGVLTAGTGAAGTVDLDITIARVGGMTLGANVNDNGLTKVVLVKNGIGGLNFRNTTDNTYSGGTFINEGFITTGLTSNRRYLGTGAVVINSGASLALNQAGATSFSGSLVSPTYTARPGSEIDWNFSQTPASNEFFKIESGAVLAIAFIASAGAFNLSGGTQNLDAAAGAVLAEGTAGLNVSIKNGTGTIGSLTTPTYYFGLSGDISENVTVGAGTPWLGMSNDKSNRTYAGTSGSDNTITANSDFTLQGRTLLRLGNGASATNIIKIATPIGKVNANVTGTVALNNDNSEFGSAGNTVTFQVTSGSTLNAQTATAQGIVAGASTAPARIVVQNGGTLGLTSTGVAGFNGNVTILPGGMFTQSRPR